MLISNSRTTHIRGIYKEEELEISSTCKEYLQVRMEGKRKVQRVQKYYNLDVIISVGYRVKSKRGTQFRIWANNKLKEYLLKGYSANQRFDKLENCILQHDQRLGNIENKIDFFVRTSLPPVEGIFFDGQIFDAYKFASDLIHSARSSIILIDNYVDECVLLMLSKRRPEVIATIYTQRITPGLELDIRKHNCQYPSIEVKVCTKAHDRFLILDNSLVYHIGASMKDLGKKMMAFSRMCIPASDILEWLTT